MPVDAREVPRARAVRDDSWRPDGTPRCQLLRMGDRLLAHVRPASFVPVHADPRVTDAHGRCQYSSVECEFVAQPITGTSDVAAFFALAERDGCLEQVDVAVAWLRRSGLDRLARTLRQVRSQGGLLRFTVGIDKGSTSRQALHEALALTPDVYVIHDERAHVTFHPKLFCAQGAGRAWLLVGSHNLTGGGTASNLEAGLRLRLDLEDQADRAVLQQVRDYLLMLRTTPQVSMHLTEANLRRLAANPRYMLRDEDAPQQQDKEQPGSADDADSSEALFAAGPWSWRPDEAAAAHASAPEEPLAQEPPATALAPGPVSDRAASSTISEVTLPPLPALGQPLRQSPPPRPNSLGRELQPLWDTLHAVLLALGPAVLWDKIDKGFMYRGRGRFAMPVANQDNVYVHLYNIDSRVPEAAGLDLQPGRTYVGLRLRGLTDLRQAQPFLQRTYRDSQRGMLER